MLLNYKNIAFVSELQGTGKHIHFFVEFCGGNRLHYEVGDGQYGFVFHTYFTTDEQSIRRLYEQITIKVC